MFTTMLDYISTIPTLWEYPQTASKQRRHLLLFFTYSRYVTSDYDDFSNETLQMRFNSNEACVDIKLIDVDIKLIDG
jgi:hypothetical protein